MSDAIWLLGATGRSGRAIARRLTGTGRPLVLTGRDASRLKAAADDIGADDIVSAPFEELLSRIGRAAPTVVVNTVGPFARTAPQVIEACPPGTHYVDIANELPAVTYVLGRNDEAVREGRTLVTGAGFGVVATESTVLRVCENRPVPERVRVDALASVAIEQGVLGEALAHTIIDGMPDGGRRVEHGLLVRAGVAIEPERLTTPDGDVVTTAMLPTGDLVAAWRASGAPSVVSATSEVPSGRAVRLAFPPVMVLMRSAALRRLAVDRLARVSVTARDRPRVHSWGHARVQWGDGTVHEGWLRMGDAHEFTAAAAADVARRLAGATVRRGAFTPGALFGASFGTDIGAQFIDVAPSPA